MLDIQQIKNAYPQQYRPFERSLIREYLQVKILHALFSAPNAEKLSFLGGTALRILHGNNRFSEDIDLDHFGVDWAVFGDMARKVQRYLELEGFQVEMRLVEKGAYHCYIKIPRFLFTQGVSVFPDEKILIRIDTFAQGYTYSPDIKIINQFDVFSEIRVTPPPVLLAQKIFTSVSRARPKGRDFYDITFLLFFTQPDYGFFKLKWDISEADELRAYYADRIKHLDFQSLAQDVAPFLINQDQIARVLNFKSFWDQVDLK